MIQFFAFWLKCCHNLIMINHPSASILYGSSDNILSSTSTSYILYIHSEEADKCHSQNDKRITMY